MFDSVFLLVKVTLTMMGHKIVQYCNQFLSHLKYLMVLLIKCCDGNLKGCQKKV